MNIDEIRLDEEIGSVCTILCELDKKKGVLIPILHRIQEDYGFLPGEVLETLSKKIAIPLADIYSVGSFYKQFHFTPRGKKVVRVCTGTACHVRGASTVVEKIKDTFQVEDGETTEDLKLTLETVGCIGCCGLAPVATVNEAILGEIGQKKLHNLIEEIEKEEEEEEDNGKGNGNGEN